MGDMEERTRFLLKFIIQINEDEKNFRIVFWKILGNYNRQLFKN